MTDKTDDKSGPATVTVHMVGNSRGNADGQQRRVSAEMAEHLVTEKLARTEKA